MKKILFFVACLLYFAAGVYGQNASSIILQKDTFQSENVKSIEYDNKSYRLHIAYPINEMKSVKFDATEIDLSQADKKVSGNEITRFSLEAEYNDGVVLSDIEAKISGSEISIFVPYLGNKTTLRPTFASKGEVYVNGVLQKSGVSVVDFTNEVTYKVRASSGEIRTYTVKIENSGLPIVKIETQGELASKVWSDELNITLTSADGKELLNSTAQVKAKGVQSSSIKNDINIKLSKKSSVLGMEKNKRWVLLANSEDASMLRTKLGLTLGENLDGLSWTPKAEYVELVLGGKHLGTYLVAEQIRVSDGRVSESAVWKIDNEMSADDDYFVSQQGTLCILEDSDSDNVSDLVSSTKKIIDAFESAINSSKFDYTKYIDEDSFVDWIWANEITRNNHSSMPKNCYFRITKDGKIAMSPIFTSEKWIGNNSQSYEGLVSVSGKWCEALMKSESFAQKVCKRFAEISSTESTLTSAVEENATLIALSSSANNEIWGLENSLTTESSNVKQWIKNRYAWLKKTNDNICKCSQKINATSQNEIKSFSLSKSANGSAVFSDYSATIKNNNIDVFVPYLVEFDLKADFTAASGATIYCDGEEVKSGQTKINYLKEKQFKVVASNGDVRVYNVNIHNSGLPVLFINTKNGASINSKDTWLTDTEFKCYNADGTLDYSADDSEVKGRGNSTWSASQDKRPYALRLSKKDRLLGMAEHKRWVLMANWYDATFFRNNFSNWLGKKYTNQQWVSSGYNVELVLNGSHKGNYYFCEQAKIHENRVEGEYLIEADIKEKGTSGGFGGGWGWGGGGSTNKDDGSIDGSKSNNAFYTKHPELDPNSAEYKNVKSIIEKFENALYGGNYNEVEKLVDLESFVDWYMIKEWSHDVDGNMHTSCYFTIMDDGKIKMGPMWDFDLAWGGNPLGDQYNRTEGYYITTNPISQSSKGTTTSWFGEFIKMPAFKALLKKKVNVLNANIDEIIAYIDENTEKLVLSATVSQSRNGSGGGGMWGGFGGGGGGNTSVTADEYRKSMEKLKTFVKTRIAWFTKEVNSF